MDVHDISFDNHTTSIDNAHVMKLLAVSDEVVDWIYSAQLRERCADVDLVVSCGDLPISYLEFIASSLNKPCYFVRGNHDTYVFSPTGEVTSAPEGWINLDKRVSRCNDVVLAGLEGCIRYKPSAPYQYTQAEQRWRAMMLSRQLWLRQLTRGRGMDVLIAHSPAYGIHDATDHAHVGFQALNWLIDTFKPRLMLHGHQHRNYSPRQTGETHVGDTHVINVHPYRILELPV